MTSFKGNIAHCFLEKIFKSFKTENALWSLRVSNLRDKLEFSLALKNIIIAGNVSFAMQFVKSLLMLGSGLNSI